MSRVVELLVFMSLATTPCNAQGNLTDPPKNGTGNLTEPFKTGKWMKCIGGEIAECLSCVLETSSELVETVLAAAANDEEETVEGILKTIGKAAHCAVDCRKASTKLVAKQCHKSWYCKTDFCVRCCGSGSWQCLGNDFTPQCAPKSMTGVQKMLSAFDKASKKLEGAIADIAVKAEEKVQVAAEHLVDEVMDLDFVGDGLNVSSGVQHCTCGKGSGNKDSCCSKCKPSKDKHNVPHCTGGGENTGPFCGNDFHVTEPDACYGETPICCTNDMNTPVCCRKDQVCHSPDVGKNECRNAFETLMV